MKTTVYITRYALTKGIEEIETAIPIASDTHSVAAINAHGRVYQHFHGQNRDWHLTKESAIQRANKMKDARIKSLTKQLNALKTLTFS